MPHTHLNHQDHHHLTHQHHVGYHEAKRGMDNKIIWWVIGIVLVAVIVVAAFFFVPKGEETVYNPDPVAEQCAYLCETNQKTGFCSFNLDIDENLRTNCNELATNPNYAKYNVQPCQTFSCAPTTSELDKTCINGLKGSWETPTSDGLCPVKEGKTSRQTTPSDNSSIAGQVCCFYF